MAETASAGPELVPLSQARHGSRRWRGPKSYEFARQYQFVPVVLAEVEITATALPLVFATEPKTGLPQPVALLRLQAQHSPFITSEGRWLAPYIPALLRVHPFSARQAAQDARMELLVDEASGLISDNVHDNRFFDPCGAPSDALQSVVAFFRQYESSARDTRRACKALAELRDTSGQSAFRPLELKGFQSQAFHVLDRKLFDGMDDQHFLALRQAGALQLASAHFIGCQQLAWLRRAETAFEQPVRPQNTRATHAQGLDTVANDVTDFLSAVASAHSADGAAYRPADLDENEVEGNS